VNIQELFCRDNGTVLHRTSIVEETIQRIIKLIIENNLKNGSRLPSERELSERWNVSRTTIREAERALSYNGILNIRHGSGAYINQLPEYLYENYEVQQKEEINSSEDYRMCSEARYFIESAIIGLAAERITQEELIILDNILKKMKDSLNSNNLSCLAMDNLNFHFYIAKSTKNPYLLQALSFYFNGTYYSRYLSTLEKNIVHENNLAFAEHWQIYEALKRHDAVSAEKLMRQHIIRRNINGSESSVAD